MTTHIKGAAAIKGRLQKAWSSGDYGKVSVTLLSMSGLRADLRPNDART